jgi:sRNA-binding regulator protein Hfq
MMSRVSEGTSENASKLLELAKGRFGKLNKAEEKLFRSFADGGLADFSADKEKENDPAKADKWGPDRVLTADRIFWLCRDRKALELATHNGVRVKGARIDGELDLEESAFPWWISLRYAEIRNLYLVGTHTGPIYGDGLKVEGGVFLRNGFKAEGEVNLVGATIGGDLVCEKGQFINSDGYALNAGAANIGSSVYLRGGFKAEGEVNLLGSTISGALSCKNGQFINKGAIALTANSANIEGNVFLNDGFKAEGEVNLTSATIGRNLECDGSKFINKRGYAISASSMKVKGHVYMSGGFKAESLVDLSTTTIDGGLLWGDVNSPEGVILDLRSAKVGVLWDDKDSWPEEGKLFLHGLVYDEIYGKAPRDAESRIEWLQRQEGFWPQPYEQLAAVFRKGGQDEDARKVLIAKNKDRARLTELTTRSEKIWYRILGPMIGYGYRPLNALWGVLLFVVLGWILFGIGYLGGLITPHSKSAYVERNTGIVVPGDDDRYLSDVYPRYNFLIYSVDTFVPLIDLHQGKYWLPNANRGPAGRLLRFYLWFHISMGWALSTLLVVGLTGLVRT